jgi:hypothetical protein
MMYLIVRHYDFLTGRELNAPRGTPCMEKIEGSHKSLYYW